MPLAAVLIGVPFSVAFGSFGRWLQLHPEKFAPQGSFAGPHTLWARIFRAQITFAGTFAVFAGTSGAVFALLSELTFNSLVLGWVAQLVALSSGVYAAVRVRKEVRARPVPSNPHGLWP
jgi:hypothetical protein